MAALFGNYEQDAQAWVSVQARYFYPDYLTDAQQLYESVFARFGELLGEAADSEGLLRAIVAEPNPLRNQLLRVFRKYVSPVTPVEMLKSSRKTEGVIERFGADFRLLPEVQAVFGERPANDEALAAIFWEHHDRGTPGYEMTEEFFLWFEANFSSDYTILGPRRAGADIQLDEALPHFKGNVPADFLVFRASDGAPLVVGFARYDSDRGGSQEDDRTAGNQDKVNRVMEYASRRRIPLKVLFVNDGPGLLLGSMWRDYASLEASNVVDGELRVMVVTLKMLEERVTREWIES